MGKCGIAATEADEGFKRLDESAEVFRHEHDFPWLGVSSGADCLDWDAAEKGKFSACQIAPRLNVF
jgi:hypothetical protein